MSVYLTERGTPLPGQRPLQGPWLQTQLTIAILLGSFSVLAFSYLRTRYTLAYAPRTKLKGFSPSTAHLNAHSNSFFGWILPTLRTPDLTVLQVVGLDAAVLLSFFKMGFLFFSSAAAVAGVVLVPYNLKVYGSLDSQPDDDNSTNPDNSTELFFAASSALWSSSASFDQSSHHNSTFNNTLPSFVDVLTDPTTSLSLHLLFTYIFTFLALFFVYRNFQTFIRNRQLFSLELVHSISARTVLLSNLPNHLRGDRPLAEYFENLGMSVESVSVVREIGSLASLLERRTNALLRLEAAWTAYVGNPSKIAAYTPPSTSPPASTPRNPSSSSTPISELVPSQSSAPEQRIEYPGLKRPLVRMGGNSWAFWRPKVDAIEYWQGEFEAADESVRRKRRNGKFRSTGAAFVTFENMIHAQITCQTQHAPRPDQCISVGAPEPRDVVWSNVGKSERNRLTRDIVIMCIMTVLLLFWAVPVTFLASLLSYKEIKRGLPWLARLIDKSPQARSLVQNTLPSMALISFNALLPFLLEGLSYSQGFQARSWIEYSLLKKYFLFLLISTVFVFAFTTTYWELALELAGTPIKVPERIAQSLSAGPARHFFMSLVLLQGIGTMPFQLLNVPTILSTALYRALYTRTPRDFAELNAPPMLNYGAVYPQAILVFVVVLLYSVVSPLILIFGAIYFGSAYLVFKYKLLFVFYKPYESSGQAWPITFTRLLLGISLFQIFMLGLFTLNKAVWISTMMVPLIIGTWVFSYQCSTVFEPLCKNVSLSLIAEVQHGEAAENVMRVPQGEDSGVASRPETNLNRRRYAINQDDLYVAPATRKTDYSQGPMSGYYPGVLNTGRRRYAHPALAGLLPTPWLPQKASDTLLSQATSSSTPDASLLPTTNSPANGQQGDLSVVLSLRRRAAKVRKAITPTGKDKKAADEVVATSAAGGTGRQDAYGSLGGEVEEWERNPWRNDSVDKDRKKTTRRLSFDPASGVISLPEGDSSSEDEEDDGHLGRDDETNNEPSESTPLFEPTSPKGRHKPFFPHPERSERRRTMSSPKMPDL